MTNLFLLERVYDEHAPIYDCNNRVIVRAHSEAEARAIMNRPSKSLVDSEGVRFNCYNYADEGAIWEDPESVTCRILEVQGPCAIIMKDSLNG
jgi:hypothetical protein